jgi:hypothetical protein
MAATAGAAGSTHRLEALTAAGFLEVRLRRGHESSPPAPSGWPMAMAPPWISTSARSTPATRCAGSTTWAKASLTSNASISPRSKQTRPFQQFLGSGDDAGEHGKGVVSDNAEGVKTGAGAEPGSYSASAMRRVTDPSLSGEALPAVMCRPISEKALVRGRSRGRP